MVGPERMRRAAAFLQKRFKVSERRACRVIGLARSTRRYAPRKPSQSDQKLIAAMLDIAGEHKRWGYRRVRAKLRADGLRTMVVATRESSGGSVGDSEPTRPAWEPWMRTPHSVSGNIT